MIPSFPRLVRRIAWAALVCLFNSHAFSQPSNGVLREVYLNLSGSALVNLTNTSSFPGSPSFETIQPAFEAPNEFGDNYGQRMRALLVPPQTGPYVFWIASDDNGALYLSTDETPSRRVPIATVNTWTSLRQWTKETNQQSVPIMLTNGFRYYVEALQKEGSGGDNLSVRWQLPNNVIEEPIPNNRLLVYGLGPPVITRQPTNVTIVEATSAGFTIGLDHMIGAAFQWQRNGTNIPGATNATYFLGLVTLADNTNRFACFVTNAFGATNSAPAILTVLPDTNKPTLVAAGNLGDVRTVFVIFSEPVETASATDAANYTLDGGANVTRAVFGVDTRTILLTTSPLLASGTYLLTVNNVRDRATTPNVILPNSQKSFSLATRPLDVYYLSPSHEPLGPSSRRHGVVISELMYHPTNRSDGRNIEFIEIYNAQPWFEELDGWRISGAVDYTFPSNTILPSRSFLIVAANPADFRAVYSFTNVLGPFASSNELRNSSGTLRLRNRSDAILFEMNYQGDAPFPAAADGGGHSLVLARPSYGEMDPRAWTQSDIAGGNPGAPDSPTGNSFRSILINEFLAHSESPQLDFIELFNYGNATVNLGNCLLTDDPATNKFTIPANTLIAPRSFLVFTEAQLGFSLASGGETILLRNPQSGRVIDAIRFGAQEKGVAMGRSPDGAPYFSRLAAPTPGTNNASLRSENVVINEIMFDPISSDANDEYVELHNRSTNAVNLGGWRLRGALSFDFPSGVAIPSGGYLVVAKNAARLRANYPTLTPANTLGDYHGGLSKNGERVELNMPEVVLGTNSLGELVTNTVHIIIDEVAYGSGGRWGRWAGGGGSSLELRDARTDRRLAGNWADSDESAKSPWVNVETTGVMDNGWADASQLHITLQGAGECLIDNVEVIPANGANVIANGTFESGTAGWVFQGNHNQTSWENTEGFASSSSLHLRATGRGDSGANRIRTQFPSTLSPGTTVTLRAKVRWLKGHPNILLRLRGNWLEAPGTILAAKNLGTPGAPNSRATLNLGPAISEVRHEPALPAAGQPLLVLAQVQDPDGLAFLAVNYRIDPSTAYTSLAMSNNGAGLFSTVIPGQPAGVAAAFYLQALDNFAPPAASLFPDDAPARECIVRWGDNTIPGTLPTYRWWLSQTNVSRWSTEEKMSNNPKDITFIYGTNRVIYNAGAWFHGSPYHSPGYDSPVGASCDYDLGFPGDDRLLGETDINLFRPGNGGGDGTSQAEIHGYWFASQFGLPFLYHKPVFVFVNGLRRSTVFHDAQQPNGDYVREWFSDDADGELHKVQLGFEFGDQAYGSSEPGYAVVGANLSRYVTTGNVKKQARYRATWPLRSVSPYEQNNYTNLFNLVETVLTNAPLGSDAYTQALTNAVDVAEWFKVHVTQHLYNNPDSFSYGGGQNAFAYKPARDGWKLLLWDIDFAFGGNATDPNLFSIGGSDHGPRNDHPPFNRLYWQALIEAANGFLAAARSEPIIDSRYNGMVASGAAVGDPTAMKTFIANRRAYILSVLATNQFPFAITSNGGADFSTNRNLITLSGLAPLEARSLLVNGIAYSVTWTTRSNWVMRLSLAPGTNTLIFSALNAQGAGVADVGGTIRINYTGLSERAQDKVVLNEIMYNPAVPNTSYIEIFNSSVSNAFDLSGWRLEGVGFIFPDGTILEPGAYLLVVKDRFTFVSTYGSSFSIAGEFPGRLNNGGETLTLIKPGPSPELDIFVDQVTYDNSLPWPAVADGRGSSLQLIDPAQDNNRSANWTSTSTNPPPLRQWQRVAVTGTASSSTLYVFLQTAGEIYIDDLQLVAGTVPEVGTNVLSNGDFETAFPGLWVISTNHAGSSLSTNIKHSGQASLHVVATSGGTTRTSSIYQDIVPALPLGAPYTLSFWYLATTNYGALTIRLSGNGISATVNLTGSTNLASATPGAVNNVRASLPVFPPLWLNEVLPNNSSAGTNSLADRFNELDPWVELYNGGTNPISLAGYWLANNYTNLAQWPFPSNAVIGPKQFLLVWLDGQSSQSSATEWHANFRLAPEVGSIVLSSGAGLSSILDYLNYNLPVSGRSFGSYPDGTASKRRAFSLVTPGVTNNPLYPAITISINEWMADNVAGLTNPATGGFDDWFELYNPSSNRVDLSGYYLSDLLSDPRQWAIPNGVSIGPRDYLLVWADNLDSINNPTNRDLHAPFSLAKNGEALGLFAPDGAVIDTVTFGPQATDASEGRYPDGAATIYAMTNVTPRAPNQLLSQTNTPPTLSFVSPRMVHAETLLSFTAAASDADIPAQALSFFLEPGAPAGAAIGPVTGRFTWTPPTNALATNLISIRVEDTGSPPLRTSKTLTVYVVAPLRATATRAGPTVALTFPTVAGGIYRIEYKTNLTDPVWTRLNANVPASGNYVTITDNVGANSQRFYRIVQNE